MQHGKPQKDPTDQCDDNELRPNHREPGAAIQDRSANETKCVEGDTCIIIASHAGLLSSGVLLPESMFIGRKTSR